MFARCVCRFGISVAIIVPSTALRLMLIIAAVIIVVRAVIVMVVGWARTRTMTVIIIIIRTTWLQLLLLPVSPECIVEPSDIEPNLHFHVPRYIWYMEDIRNI